MVALFITVDILELSKHKLNMNEYFTLLKFQHDLEGKSFPFVPDGRFFDILRERGMIVLGEDNKYTLGPEGLRIFNGDDLFEQFYAVFPHKVPTGTGFRPVSTNDPNGVSAKVTRALWNRVTKNKPFLQQNIIDSLKRELAHRTADGSLAYLQNIDTWLRQATWEKWSDIPDKKNTTNTTKL